MPCPGQAFHGYSCDCHPVCSLGRKNHPRAAQPVASRTLARETTTNVHCQFELGGWGPLITQVIAAPEIEDTAHMSINGEWGCGPGGRILYSGEKEQNVSVGNNMAKTYKSIT